MQVNQNAPVFQYNEIFIPATLEKVWDVLTDVPGWPAWNKKISKAQLTQPVAAGSAFRWTINGAAIRSVFHTVEENRALGWSGVTFGATAIHNWFFTLRDGGVQVRVEESMEGWLVALFRKKMNRDLATDMQYWLEALKTRCAHEHAR